MRFLIFISAFIVSSMAHAETCPEVGSRYVGNWDGCSCHQKKEAVQEWAICGDLKEIVGKYSGNWFSEDDPQECKHSDYRSVHSRAKARASTVIIDEVRLNYLVGKEWNTWCGGEDIYDFSQIFVPLSSVNCTRSGDRVREYKKCRSHWK